MYKLERISEQAIRDAIMKAQPDIQYDYEYVADAQRDADQLILDQANADIGCKEARIKDLEAINQSHKELNGKLSAQLATQLTAEEERSNLTMIEAFTKTGSWSYPNEILDSILAKLKAQAELEQAISDLDQASKCLKCIPFSLEECRVCEEEK